MIATACGYSWPQIDEMTIPQYLSLAAYWKKYPPIHLLINSLLRYKSDEARTDSLAGLLATVGKDGTFGSR